MSNNDWETPQEVFAQLDARYGPFDVDVCADHRNTKCCLYFSMASNGLQQRWTALGARPTVAWCNPPYGRGQVTQWLAKADQEYNDIGTRTVMLLNYCADADYFRPYLHLPIVLVTPRIQFDVPPGTERSSNNHGQMLVLFGVAEIAQAWDWKRRLWIARAAL